MKVVPRKLPSWALILVLTLSWFPLSAAEGTAQGFKPEEIEQIVAPSFIPTR